MIPFLPNQRGSRPFNRSIPVYRNKRRTHSRRTIQHTILLSNHHHRHSACLCHRNIAVAVVGIPCHLLVAVGSIPEVVDHSLGYIVEDLVVVGRHVAGTEGCYCSNLATPSRLIR